MACQLGARPPTKGFTFTMHLVDAPELDFKYMAPHAKRNLKPSTCHTETHNTGRTPIHGPGLPVSSFCKRRICLFESRYFFLATAWFTRRSGDTSTAWQDKRTGLPGPGCRDVGGFFGWDFRLLALRIVGVGDSGRPFGLSASRVRVRFGVRRCMTNEWNCDLQVVLQTTKCFTPTTDSTTMMEY